MKTGVSIPFDRERCAIEKFIDPVCKKYRIEPFAKAAFGGNLSVFGKTVIDNRCDAPIQNWADAIAAVRI